MLKQYFNKLNLLYCIVILMIIMNGVLYGLYLTGNNYNILPTEITYNSSKQNALPNLLLIINISSKKPNQFDTTEIDESITRASGSIVRTEATSKEIMDITKEPVLIQNGGDNLSLTQTITDLPFENVSFDVTTTGGATRITTTQIPRSYPDVFKPKMTDIEKKIVVEMLDTFDKITKTYNLTYFIYGGTMIGSWRHHGIIPWDDDIDLMMNASQKAQVYTALSSQNPLYQVWRPQGKIFTQDFQWKFYSESSRTIPHYPWWKWPFLDIFFFNENATHLWDHHSKNHGFLLKKSEVFPLSLRPFESLWLASPRQISTALDKWYNMSICASPTWDHQTERYTTSHTSVSCEELYPYFPFVTRTVDCIETLKLGGHVLHSKYVRC
ncbi:unnamed protein product [Owenia fusiformis]|uniref:LicD/FKTN/FKRP nucleotidyltransferase domain-containing protein n=1 Tax=Owenia fusiformis TaxID=6347 RepID=A0A8S4MVS8_OWEFU|nr:unnamed protein product [Owenia fusiformis]